MKFLKLVRHQEKVEFYNQMLVGRAYNGQKFPSLEEFLSLTSGNKPNEPQDFDAETDKILEAQALKLLEERRLKHGQ